jgi:hypothetical protein
VEFTATDEAEVAGEGKYTLGLYVEGDGVAFYGFL